MGESQRPRGSSRKLIDPVALFEMERRIQEVGPGTKGLPGRVDLIRLLGSPTQTVIIEGCVVSLANWSDD